MTSAATANGEPGRRGPGRPRVIDTDNYGKRNFRILEDDWKAVCDAAASGSPSGTEIVRAALHAAAAGVDVVGVLERESVRATR